jgi:A/G-specific adenine glycosylase
VKTIAVETATARALGRSLLAWYEKEQRDLPWRRSTGSSNAGHSLDPYAVWISEMMLQQTQVRTVIPYFQRWMQRFPNVASLAAADEGDVLHAWQGLGYYSRARNLRHAAQEMLDRHEGRVPERVSELLALPGIGPYTAGAIASIAYGHAEPLVDGNVIRVLTRLFARRGDPSRAPLKAELWALARRLLPKGAPGDFNQALMELGATLCSPRAPRCGVCPVAAQCLARQQNLTELVPELPVRARVTQTRMVAAIALRRGRVLVTKLSADAPRWAGMWLFPNAELGSGETPAAAVGRALKATTGVRGNAGAILCTVQHSVTRFRITLDAHRAVDLQGVAKALTVAEVAWQKPSDLSGLAMPKAHRVIAERLANG